MDILVVEDDDLIRELLAEWLADEGFAVVAKPTAEAAIEAVERAASPPGVAILDLHLGAGMGGIALAQKLTQRWPDIGILYATGYLSDLDSKILGPRERYLSKPYSREDLLRLVRYQAPGKITSWLRRCAEVLGPPAN